MSRPKIRLHVEHPLSQGQTVDLSREQANYLFAVMRLGEGDEVALFNGHDGEWRAVVTECGRRGGTLEIAEQTAPQQDPPDLWLLFAPIKKTRTDFIVEKAAELGAARIIPVQTEHTNAERIRRDRLQAHAIEAAEQCGGTFVPGVEELHRLSDVLDNWPEDRRLVFADEALVGAKRALAEAPQATKWAILTGPEGGFSEAERTRLLSLPFVTPISLGPRILRADTAAVAALALWQAERGDWR
ncbi:16S rRNA (uracil(1498)-N(3))-methyltransferase [Roseibacterium sp. SDUM158016]|uniref:16S rRNA (uracil(1498)-N(3))-methyltransferase n=1 Tax=Roseicyclus sediminis TaxID=2980997 RepID=UPI0021CFAE60|nr:16S rRNA (uracil(1498)-N(3))-methyltransferase [Roseibacterium sp. SDUM158016]MCU4651366.1 16S rRNA (uracil(1498)-N(3))-methyltransferase [Roseibacterium sp. SDUM158016]